MDFVLTSVFSESKSSLHLDGLLVSEDYSVTGLAFQLWFFLSYLILCLGRNEKIPEVVRKQQVVHGKGSFVLTEVTEG